jgi:ElaB/YqjD/DUF883 family membrane-anchored ribosome-binding protein
MPNMEHEHVVKIVQSLENLLKSNGISAETRSRIENLLQLVRKDLEDFKFSRS